MWKAVCSRQALVGGVLLFATMALSSGLSTASAYTFTRLYSFCQQSHCADGKDPRSALTMDAAGNLYGTTTAGGSAGVGTIYKLSRNDRGKWKQKVLHSFCSAPSCTDGSTPWGGVVIDGNGNLYGTTMDGGARGKGVVYRWSRKSFQVLHDFCSQKRCADGHESWKSLTYAGAASGVMYDGSSPLYGVTYNGGLGQGGVVFQISRKHGVWSESGVYAFCEAGDPCADGSHPVAPLMVDAAGNLFGTTIHGGVSLSGYGGVLFKLTPAGSGDWAETVLHKFCSSPNCEDGAYPRGGLIADAAGNLFGTTTTGGVSNQGSAGTVYKYGVDSAFSVLHTFCIPTCPDGFDPDAGVIMDQAGSLFGTTPYGGVTFDSGGTVFRLGPSFDVLYTFCAQQDCVDGNGPTGGVIQDAAGNLFGATEKGGLKDGGTVYELSR